MVQNVKIVAHSGIKGMRWGIRRWQNKDGSLTPAGKKHYADLEEATASFDKEKKYYEKIRDSKRAQAQSMRTAEEQDNYEYKLAERNAKLEAIKNGKLAPEKTFKSAIKKGLTSALETQVEKVAGQLISNVAVPYGYNKLADKLSVSNETLSSVFRKMAETSGLTGNQIKGQEKGKGGKDKGKNQEPPKQLPDNTPKEDSKPETPKIKAVKYDPNAEKAYDKPTREHERKFSKKEEPESREDRNERFKNKIYEIAKKDGNRHVGVESSTYVKARDNFINRELERRQSASNSGDSKRKKRRKYKRRTPSSQDIYNLNRILIDMNDKKLHHTAMGGVCIMHYGYEHLAGKKYVKIVKSNKAKYKGVSYVR